MPDLGASASGSRTNGNPTVRVGMPPPVVTALPHQEVELMETSLRGRAWVSTTACSKALPHQEVELMETITIDLPKERHAEGASASGSRTNGNEISSVAVTLSISGASASGSRTNGNQPTAVHSNHLIGKGRFRIRKSN